MRSDPCEPASTSERDAVGQAQRGILFLAAGVGVDVDEAWHDELAGSVDDIGGAGRRDVLLHRRDLAVGDRDVDDLIELPRRIHHAPALDEQVVLRGAELRQLREVGQRGRAGGGD